MYTISSANTNQKHRMQNLGTTRAANNATDKNCFMQLNWSSRLTCYTRCLRKNRDQNVFL